MWAFRLNKSNQVSGITNLARNLGGSVGISMLSTLPDATEPAPSGLSVSAHTAGDPALTRGLRV